MRMVSGVGFGIWGQRVVGVVGWRVAKMVGELAGDRRMWWIGAEIHLEKLDFPVPALGGSVSLDPWKPFLLFYRFHGTILRHQRHPIQTHQETDPHENPNNSTISSPG